MSEHEELERLYNQRGEIIERQAQEIERLKREIAMWSSTLRRAQGGYLHWCPGCKQMHVLPDSWQFDGNLEQPTFSPSFKHSWSGSFNGKEEDGICHYVLTAGVLNFCADCTHVLASQSVPLPPLPEGLTDEK